MIAICSQFCSPEGIKKHFSLVLSWKDHKLQIVKRLNVMHLTFITGGAWRVRERNTTVYFPES